MIIAESLPSIANASPIRAGAALPPEIFQRIRLQMVLDGCKWDPQVGDSSTISSFPLLINRSNWRQLSQLVKLLSAELLAAELELLARPELHQQLGLPRRIRRLLRRAPQVEPTHCAARVLRFDFHWTTAGWRISEVNSDVPGGFSEASELPLALVPHYPHTSTAEIPGEAWAKAMIAATPTNLPIALLAAPGFLEDQQVLSYLARQLTKLGRTSVWATPDHLHWHQGHAQCQSQSYLGPIGAIVRFYQAEWLNVRHCSPLFIGGQTPVTNPGIAILTESKRFPLIWDRLSTRLPTWRKLLPSTVDPRDADWLHDDSWILKSALCNTGDTVSVRSLLPDSKWRAAARTIRKRPHHWIAQRKFQTCALKSSAGTIYPCIGVYTINGYPAGMYGRYSHTPVINYAAIDAAVLIEDSQED